MLMTEKTPFTGIPADLPAINELACRDQWVVWKYEKSSSGNQTKIPVNARSGRNANSSDPETWSSFSEAVQFALSRKLAGVGYVLTDDDEYTGIDLDKCIDDDGNIEPWAQEILDLCETYAEYSPSGNGIRMFAKGKIDRSIGSNNSRVEMYRTTRYLTVTGSHVYGSPKEIKEAPETVKRLLARVNEFRANTARPFSQPALPSYSQSSTSIDEIRDMLFSIHPDCPYDDWLKAMMAVHDMTNGSAEGFSLVDNWSSGGSKYPGTTEVEFKWRSFRGAGVGSGTLATIAQSYGADLSEIAKRYTIYLEPTEEQKKEWKQIADNLLEGVLRLQREKEGVRQIVEQKDGTIADAETGEIIEVASDDDENIGGALDYFDLPDDQVTPPGLVGRIADWIYETAGDPIKVHAVGAALVIVGTLLGRKVLSQSRPTGTNLYVGALAPSGYGKDHPRVCMQLILNEFLKRQGQPMHISMLPKSDTKLASMIYDRPSSVMIVDEFASKLAHTKGKNASTSAVAITELFLEIWGKSQSDYEVPSALSRSEQTIMRPSLSFYGTSTIKVFAETLISKDVTSGLYNRFLFLPYYGDVPSRPEINGLLTIPERVLAECGWVYECLDDHQMTLSRTGDTCPPNPVMVPFSDDAAQMHEENRAFQKKMQLRADDDSALALYGRYAEQIKRIAMIVACGRSTEFVSCAVIEASDMEFAKRIVSWSIGQAVLMVRRDMVENWIDANRKKVISIIRSKKSLKRAALIRMTSGIKGRDLDEIINYLKQAECIEELSIKTSRRPVTIYKYVKG